MQLVTIDLGHVEPGAYVKLIDPAHMPWGTKKRLVKALGGKIVVKDDGSIEGVSAEDVIGATEMILADLIEEWNLRDSRTGDPLPIPRRDPNALDRADSQIVEEFVKRFSEIMKTGFTTAQAQTPQSGNQNG